MNAEDLKAGLIHALNFGQADHFLDTICRLHDLYGAGGVKALENALFMLTVDIRQMNRCYQKNQQELKEYRAESAAQARLEESRQAAEDRIRSGKMTDEEGDREALEAYRHPPRKAA